MNRQKFVAAFALAAAVTLPSLVSAQQIWTVNGYRHHYPRQARGIIAVIDKTDVTLRNGRHVFLHNGTIINPTGKPLRVGQLIEVFGPPGGNGAINAREIDILPRYGM